MQISTLKECYTTAGLNRIQCRTYTCTLHVYNGILYNHVTNLKFYINFLNCSSLANISRWIKYWGVCFVWFLFCFLDTVEFFTVQWFQSGPPNTFQPLTTQVGNKVEKNAPIIENLYLLIIINWYWLFLL